MKILIQKNDDHRVVLENNIRATVNLLITPFLDKLARICHDNRQKNLVAILKENIQEIISPFSRNLVSEYVYLTATEIQVADLIKNMHQNKEIAELLNLSPHTIIAHRKNIRKKLGIAKTKSNLRSYLLRIS